jgi:hypothetical protein
MAHGHASQVQGLLCVGGHVVCVSFFGEFAVELQKLPCARTDEGNLREVVASRRQGQHGEHRSETPLGKG